MKGARRIGRITGSGFYLTLTCPQCSNPFPISCCMNDWPFQRKGVFLCGWSCLRAWEREHPPKRNSIYLDYLA